MKLNSVQDVCLFIQRAICNNPVCIETGSTFFFPWEEVLKYSTTYCIANFLVGPKKGTFYSLDKDPKCSEVVSHLSKNTNTHFILGDSVESLNTLSLSIDNVDLICFDSADFDKGVNMLREFEAIEDKLQNSHFILVDDIHNPTSEKYIKLVPLLKEREYSYIEVPTGTGMFVAWKGYEMETN